MSDQEEPAPELPPTGPLGWAKKNRLFEPKTRDAAGTSKPEEPAPPAQEGVLRGKGNGAPHFRGL